MKHILITGAGSYIGNAIEKHLSSYPNEYSVETLDMIGSGWRKKDFTEFDTVIHVAGIVHINETTKNAGMYYKINRDLAFETAKKAKESGVKQFIFFSTMNVYGMSVGKIDKITVPAPKSNYGKSKLQAEELLYTLSDSSFCVTVLRPPMVYGEGCKGNFRTLSKWACILPFFPNYKNKRSMISVSNLCTCVQKLIDNRTEGKILPQDDEFVCTSRLVADVAKEHNHKIYLTPVFNWAIILMLHMNIGCINKIFGDLTYEKEK